MPKEFETMQMTSGGTTIAEFIRSRPAESMPFWYPPRSNASRSGNEWIRRKYRLRLAQYDTQIVPSLGELISKRTGESVDVIEWLVGDIDWWNHLKAKADIENARNTMSEAAFMTYWEKRNDELRNLGIKTVGLSADWSIALCRRRA